MKRLLVSFGVASLGLLLVAAGFVHNGYTSGNPWLWLMYKLGITDSPIVILGTDGLLFTRGGPLEADDYRGVSNPDDRIATFKSVWGSASRRFALSARVSSTSYRR